MGGGVRMGVVWETERENGRWDSIKDGRRGTERIEKRWKRLLVLEAVNYKPNELMLNLKIELIYPVTITIHKPFHRHWLVRLMFHLQAKNPLHFQLSA